MQRKINSRQMDDKNMAQVEIPEIKIPNKFYHNTGNLFISGISPTASGMTGPAIPMGRVCRFGQ